MTQQKSYVEREKDHLPLWLSFILGVVLGTLFGHFAEDTWWVLAVTYGIITLLRLTFYSIALHRERWSNEAGYSIVRFLPDGTAEEQGLRD